MTYVITQKCAGTCAQTCVDACPSDCIHGPIDPTQLFIDPDECIDCGACLPVCPADAIYHEDDVPAEHRADIARNASFYGDRLKTVNLTQPMPRNHKTR